MVSHSLSEFWNDNRACRAAPGFALDLLSYLTKRNEKNVRTLFEKEEKKDKIETQLTAQIYVKILFIDIVLIFRLSKCLGFMVLNPQKKKSCLTFCKSLWFSCFTGNSQSITIFGMFLPLMYALSGFFGQFVAQNKTRLV